jgi:DNA-binding response OmpR family regulator
MKALIVDDDLALADVVSFTMRRAGYDALVANDGISAIDNWQREDPDLIILDLNIPEMDGMSVCRHIRAQSHVPIIILSVRGEEDDIVAGLELGADDYIVKPFSPRQLVARSEALLRRATREAFTQEPLSADGFTIDMSRLMLMNKQGVEIHLTRLEGLLLETLMLNPNQVIPAGTLIDTVWGPAGGDRVMLKQLVYRLRKKIEQETSSPSPITTISGIGYSFET